MVMSPEKTAERAAMRDKFNAFLENFDRSITPRQGLVQSWRDGFDSFLDDFLRGQLIIKKPRVLRNAPSKHYGLELEDRTVVVSSHFAFTSGAMFVTPFRLGIWVTRNQSGQLEFEYGHFPAILEEYGIQYTTLQQVLSRTARDEFMPIIHDALGPRWAECQQRLVQEIQRIDQNIHQIVEEHVTKYSVKERKALQKKLSTLLEKSQDLIDAPPEVLFALYQVSPDEIKKFAGHIKRNPNDVDVVELEDIVDAQNQARVRRVMTT